MEGEKNLCVADIGKNEERKTFASHQKNITKSSLIKVKESTQFRNFYVCRILATSAKR